MANDHIKGTPQAQIDADAREAEALTNNAFLQRMFDEIEETYTREWKDSDAPHEDYRERAYYMIRTLNKLRNHINQYRVSGNLDKQQVKNNLKNSK